MNNKQYKHVQLSVVIPVKNGAATLGRCLKSLRSQTIDNLDIIILDSNSTDTSREIAKQYEVKIINIPKGTFDHGLTRNVGADNALGELVYFTVQDAWIPENNMLEKMSGYFHDVMVQGVVGHQAIPHEKDKNPFYWYRPFSKPEISIRQINDVNSFVTLSQEQQKDLVAWDNVVSMYRKTALKALPFASTEFAEDWVWSYNALIRGWKLIRDPSLLVYHYHHQSYHYIFNSTYTLNYHFYKFFRYKPSIPAMFRKLATITYHLLKNNELSISQKMYWVAHNYSSMLGYYLSTVNFLVRLKTKNEAGIENGFKKYCNTIPQGKQKLFPVLSSKIE